jgi:hypothetical protein
MYNQYGFIPLFFLLYDGSVFTLCWNVSIKLKTAFKIVD